MDPQRIEIVVRVVVEIVQPGVKEPEPEIVEPEPVPIPVKVDPERAAEHHREVNAIARVLEHYKTYHSQSRPGAPARDRIRKRIREGYTESQLTQAIDGCHKDPWHCGENEQQKKYQSLDLIFRDSEHVQRFIELATEENNGSVLSEKSARSQRAGERFLEHFDSIEPVPPEQLEDLKW